MRRTTYPSSADKSSTNMFIRSHLVSLMTTFGPSTHKVAVNVQHLANLNLETNTEAYRGRSPTLRIPKRSKVLQRSNSRRHPQRQLNHQRHRRLERKRHHRPRYPPRLRSVATRTQSPSQRCIQIRSHNTIRAESSRRVGRRGHKVR